LSDEGTPEGTEDQGGNTSGTTPPAGNEWKPPATQEELNRIIAERVKRAEAKYAGFGDLKKKAEQFDAIAEAQKTELQKIQERAEAAEKRAADLEAAEAKRAAEAEQARQVADWKAAISKETGVPASALRGNTKEDLQAHAEEIKALLPDPNTRRVGGAYVPTEGRNVGTGGNDPAAEFGRILQNARRNAQ
jgi:septal ring factor EnvC (AmiA/AmiB activator)